MADKATLLALADRVEAAQGPDRELDKLIAVAKGWCLHPHDRQRDDSAQSDRGYTCLDCGADSWGNAGPTGQMRSAPVPVYTASLDATMTLIDGHGILMHLSDIGADGLPLARVGVPGPDDAPIFTGIASCIMTKTAPVAGLALALCAAALRARAHQGDPA